MHAIAKPFRDTTYLFRSKREEKKKKKKKIISSLGEGGPNPIQGKGDFNPCV